MVAENRGSGIPGVMRALNRAGMAPPTFRADLRRVEVTVPQHALLTPEVRAWIGSLNQEGLTEAQVRALALLREGHRVRNQTLQGWGMHPADATRDLTNLVQRGLAEKVGERMFTTNVLASELAVAPEERPRQQRILSLFSQGEALTRAQIADELPVGPGATLNDINALIRYGYLYATARARSKRRSYTRTSAGLQAMDSQKDP
ncbi:Uncharacterised protein [Mycobacteroides abscessus subsp. abscessus]|nr:Uncharacterised protein [Mycobacteroides abscessus subsp. abscessus]